MSLRDVRDKSGADLSTTVPGLVAGALLAHDVPDSTPAERMRAGRDVAESVATMPDFTRVGVRGVGLVVYVVLSALAGRPYHSLSEARRTAVTLKLTRFSFPVLGEFLRLSRGLGLVSLYEERGRGTGAEPR